MPNTFFKAESSAASGGGGQKRSDDLHTEMKQVMGELFLLHPSFHQLWPFLMINNSKWQKAALLPEAGSTGVPEVRAKKMAVSAEPAKLDQNKAVLQHHTKSAGSKQLIRDAVQKNDFLRQLAKEQIIEVRDQTSCCA